MEFTPNTPKAAAKKKATKTGVTKEEADDKLNGHEKKKINKKVEALNTIKLNLKDCVAKARTLQEYVPVNVAEHAGKVLETIAEAMSIGTDAVGKSAGDMDHIMACLANAQDEGNVAATR